MRHYPAPIQDRKIRFALVGCGRIANNHFDALRQHQDRAQLVGVCDVDPRALDRAVGLTGAEGYTSLEEMLRQVDADIVVVTTPSGLHPEQAVQIAASGRHVMTEKPMATRWEDGKRMVAACRRRRHAPVRGQAEPPQRHAAAAQERRRQEALRAHLHGQPERVLDPAPGATTTARNGAAPGNSTAAPS
jgi:predicted dehydrogenase